MNVQRVCILGGTGFVGRHLIYRLAKRGYRVRVLTRRRERHRDLLVLPTLELIEADIHDSKTLTQYFAGCEAVVNLVGILNEKSHDGHGFYRVHVELAHKIADACHKQNVKRLLHMSALNADARNGPSFYLRSKGQAEDFLHNTRNMHVTSFRPSVIFGPGDGFFNRFAKILRVTPWLLPLACPRARFAPVYVDDVAHAFVHALQDRHSFGRRYELCGPHVYSLKQLVEYTAGVLGVKSRVVGLGNFLSCMQARIFEYLPGKPFSRDNYQSLQIDSVCRDGFPFGIQPAPLEAVVPGYLTHQTSRSRYAAYRSQA